MAAAARELNSAAEGAALEGLLEGVADVGQREVLAKAFTAVRLRKGSSADLSYGGAEDKYHNGVVAPFDKQALKVIAKWVESGVNISTLRLSHHPDVDDETIQDLSAALKQNHFLDELSLFGTGVADLQPLIEALQEHNTSLTKVNVLSTPAAEDAGKMSELFWTLAENDQPLRLKFLLPKVRAHDPLLSTLHLDDRGGAKQYDDVSVRFVVAAFSGASVALSPFAVTESINRHVTSLILSNSAITVDGARLLASYLVVDTTLRVLDLSNSLQLKSSGVEALAAALTPPGSNTSVQELKLSYTNCGGERCAQVLAKMVTANESLQVLRLRGNEFPDAGRLFLKCKKISTSLRVLDVADVGIPPSLLEEIQDSPLLCDAPAALAAALPPLHANSGLLTTVNVAWNAHQGGCALNDATLQFLLEALQGNTMLTALDISGSRVTYPGLKDLCDTLGAGGGATALTTLNLSRLRFDPSPSVERPEPAKDVCRLLTVHAALTDVDLSHNYLEPDATDTLYDIAIRRRTLRRLNLDGTGVDAVKRRRIDMILPLYALPTPFAELALFLYGPGVADGELDFSAEGEWWNGHDMTSPKMASHGAQLDLTDPENRALAMRLLCEVLKEEGDITLVNVSSHLLGDAGLRPLVDMLNTTPRMQGLKLARTGITDAAITHLADAVKRNTSVVAADISGNPDISDASLDLIQAYLTFNLMPANVKSLLFDIDDDRLEEVCYTSDDPGDQLRDNWLCILVEALLRVAGKKAAGEASQVAVLDFSNSYLTNAALASLTEVLLHPVLAASIRTVKLANCVLSGTQHLATFLEAAAKAKVALVDLSCNYLGDDGYQILRLMMDRYDDLGEVRMLEDRNVPAAKQQVVLKELDTARDLNRHPHFKHCLRRIREHDATLTVIKDSGLNYNHMRVLCDVMHLSEALRELDFSHGVINDQGAGMIARGFRGNPPIEVLNLAHNKLTVMGARLLASGLEGSTHLKRMDLSFNELDGRAIGAMVELLNINCSILDVDLAGNAQITQAQLTELHNALINDQPYLKAVLPKVRVSDVATDVLDFSTTGHTALTLLRVCEALGGNTGVHTLDLSRHPVTEAGVATLAAMLEVHAALETLVLDGCGLTDALLAPLFASMQHNQGLKTLSLRDNHIADVTELVDSLGVDGCNTLQAVELQGNPIVKHAPLQVKGLENALRSNTVPLSLKRVLAGINTDNVVLIDLPGSGRGGHGDNSAVTLAAALPKCPSVLMVNLAGNLIGGDGASELADVLSDSPHVLRMDLSGNKIGEDGLRAFRRALRECYTLKRLDLEGNPGCLDAQLFAHVQHLAEANCHPQEVKDWVVAGVAGNAEMTLSIHGRMSAQQFLKVNAKVSADDQKAYDLPPLCPLLTDASVALLCAYVTRDLRDIILPYHGLECHALLRLLDATKGAPLTSVNVKCNRIKDEGAAALCARAADLPSMAFVDLAQNDISDYTVTRLMQVMMRPDRGHPDSPLIVRTRRNPRVTQARQQDVQLLNQLSTRHVDLKQLFVGLMMGDWAGGELPGGLGGGGMLDVSGRAAGDYFVDTRPATKDRKRGKRASCADDVDDMSQPWVSFFLTFLEGCPQVKGIDLSCNGVKDGAEVGRYLRVATSLRCLTLNDSPYIGKAPKPVLTAIADSLSLAYISLEGCGLTDDAAPLLEALLQGNRVLVHLNVVKNDFTDAVVDGLAAAGTGPPLTHLLLYPSSAGMTLKKIQSVDSPLVLVQ